MARTAGERMLAARNKTRLTRGQAAEKIGVTYQSIWLWETDQKIPNAANLRDLVRTYRDLGVDITMDEVMSA